MQKKVIEFNQEIRKEKEFFDFQSGDVVKVHLRIKEGQKERIQVFEGLIIAKKGGQSSSATITVRKVSHGTGVEMIVPLYSKNVVKIELVKRAKVRRAKLYYVRGLSAKKSRMKYKDISKFVVPEEKEEKVEETKEEQSEAPSQESIEETSKKEEKKEEAK